MSLDRFAEVNIGLACSTGAPLLTLAEVVREVTREGVQVLRYSVRSSTTEPTFVGLLGWDSSYAPDFAHLSAGLRQDCVAVWPVSSKMRHEPVTSAFLAGPKAAEWGSFNPDFFLTDIGA